MQLEADKYYRTKGDRKVYIAGMNPFTFSGSTHRYYAGFIAEYYAACTWRDDGVCVGGGDIGDNLIAEMTDPPAKVLRPYTRDELSRFVMPGAKLLSKTDGSRWLVVGLDGEFIHMPTGVRYDPQQLLDNFTHLCGTPCGVLE